MWRIVNQERGKDNSPRLNFTDVVTKTDGSKFDTAKEAVDALNLRFLNAAVACNAPKADVASALCAVNEARPPTRQELRFRPFIADEVYKIATSRIPSKRSRDIYGLSTEVLKASMDTLAPVLAFFFNICLEEGSYPSALKASKISPIFKGKGKRSDMDGYRPVSIIPVLAKILENGLSTRLAKHLEETCGLSPRQYAYRAGCSTTSMTRDVVRSVLAARESRRQVAVLCCDLSKAFDVADHSVLASKLDHYGIRGPSLAILTDMMKNRTQVVVEGDVESEPLSPRMGVAQGSSISNIMFSLLLNDLPGAVTSAEVFMYADDVAAIVSAKATDELERKLNETTSQLVRWFKMNGLGLNLKKTHFMHFNLAGHTTKPLVVTIDGTAINQSPVTTFLGFEIDGGLTWGAHISKLCGRLGSACFALKRIAYVVPADVARSCYFATVHSLLQYGAELWGRAADWVRVFRLQKRAVRSLVGIRSDETVRPHFKELGILTLPCIVIMQMAIYVRINLDAFKKNGEIHSRCTRNADKLSTIGRSLARSSKLTQVIGPTVYNKLPVDITNTSSFAGFKTKLKRWLIEQTFYSFNEFID